MASFSDNYGLNDSYSYLVSENRFNNQSKEYFVQNDQPYYASGTPIANNDPVSMINLSTDNPYDGRLYTERKSTVMPNTFCFGSQYRKTYVPNDRLCRAICIMEPECNSWSYDRNAHQCHLNTNSLKCEPDTNFISGKIVKNGPDTKSGRLSTVLHNVITPTVVSKPDMTLNIANANECKDVCIENAMCNRWTYIPEKCYLGYGTPNHVIPINYTTSGEIYTTKLSPISGTQVISNGSTNEIYDCYNSKLRSFEGDYCISGGDSNKSCYNIGANSLNPRGWYKYVGNMCNNEFCRDANQKCMGKPSCRFVGEKCNISNLKNLY
jgi:hypothetical protein